MTTMTKNPHPSTNHLANRKLLRVIKALVAGLLLTLVIHQTQAPWSRSTSTVAVSTDSTQTQPTFHIVISNLREPLSTLNLRSIESIFYHHPKATLILHSNAESGLLNALEDPKLKPLVKLGYDLQVDYYNPVTVLNKALAVPGNPIKKELANKFLSKIPSLKLEKYWYANEANLMRLCVLYLQGGIYLDTDVVLINDQLGANEYLDDTMGRHADGSKYHNAVMKFKPNNPFLGHVLNNMFQNYNGTKWGNNGPKAFGRTAKKHPEFICPEITIHITAPPTKANGCLLHPLPNEAFAPVSYKDWEEVCFSDSSPPYEESKYLLKDSLLVHFNNKVTGKKMQGQQFKEGSLCDRVLKDYCITCVE